MIESRLARSALAGAMALGAMLADGGAASAATASPNTSFPVCGSYTLGSNLDQHGYVLYGFCPGETVTVTTDGMPTATLTATPTGSIGVGAVDVRTIVQNAPLHSTVTATGGYPGHSFSLPGGMFAFLDPINPPAPCTPTSVEVKLAPGEYLARGFCPGEKVDLYWNGSRTETIVADWNGSINITPEVRTAPRGWAVDAVGETGHGSLEEPGGLNVSGPSGWTATTPAPAALVHPESPATSQKTTVPAPTAQQTAPSVAPAPTVKIAAPQAPVAAAPAQAAPAQTVPAATAADAPAAQVFKAQVRNAAGAASQWVWF